MRVWSPMREKVEREGVCRVGGALHGPPEPAHIIPRSRAAPGPGEDQDNCIPLCRECHARFDRQREPWLDVLPHLTRDEQAYAVYLVGVLEALTRLTNAQWGTL